MSAAPPRPGGAAGDVSLFAQLQELLHELPGLVSDRVELASLELRRAGLALARMVVLVVAAAILGVTAWLALWAVLVGLLVQAGMHWAVALLIAIAVNAGVAAWAVQRARGMAGLLGLPATRRHLTVSPSTTPPDGPPPAPPVAASTPGDVRTRPA